MKSANNRGYFVTTLGQDNLLRNTIVSDVTVNTSGVETLDTFDEEVAQSTEIPKWLISRSLLGGDLGVGFDFGFTNQLSPQTVLTGSVLDFRFYTIFKRC